MSLRTGYQYVLVIVCKSPGWVEAFPRCKADALTVAEKLLENVLSTWGVPSTIPSDQDTRFIGQIIQV